jgi:CRP-like cAMP-binding protein
MSESALPLFLQSCNKHGVKKPNPRLVQFFKEDEPILEDIEDIDLDNNYVGNRGILALLDVIEALPNFRSLSVAGQKLYHTDLSEDSVKGNPTVDRIVEVYKAHPSATALDISANPVSNYAGRKLLGLCQLNPKICRIGVKSTRIDFDLRKRIDVQCEKNTVAAWEAQAASGDVSIKEDDGEGGMGGFGGGGQWQKSKAPDLTAIGGGNRRKTVRSEGVDPEKAKAYKAPVFEKSSEDVAMITELLKSNVLFSFLGSREMKAVALAMKRQDFAKGDELLVQDGIGDCLYVIQSGQADILKEGQKVFLKVEGTAVGELELMYDCPCAATVKVATDALVSWVLDRDTYRNLVMGTAIRRREEYAKHIEKIPFLESLSAYEKVQVTDALSSDEFNEGEYIIKCDEDGEWMYMIIEGTVEVIGRDAAGAKEVVCEFAEGEYIGELEFLNNHRTVADVVAKSFVRTAKLNRRHFEMCLGPVLELLKRNSANDSKYEHYKKIMEAGNK